MEVRLRVDDLIRKTVVFVGFTDKRGSFVPCGTGFVVALMEDQGYSWQTIITAKHVIWSISSPIVHIRLNNHGGEAQIIPTPKELWFSHTDERIDVSVCPTLFSIKEFDVAPFPLMGPTPDTDCGLNDEIIRRYYIGIGDEVYIPGMFISRPGQRSNLPILRIGTIAAMPEEPIETEYGLQEAFLLEVRSTDGLSGSPVCINIWGRTLPATAPPRRLPHPSEGRPLFFLAGMILGYNAVHNPIDMVEIAPRSRRGRKPHKTQLAPVPLNTGIAVVLPIWRVLEAINQPPLKAAREEERRARLRGD
jgi:hypothetical protein